MNDAPRQMKRFYKTVAVVEDAGRFCVLLDDRQAKTPGGGMLAAPTRALGDAVADEWREQGEAIDHASMPLTSLLAAALAAPPGGDKAWADDIISYLKSDLVCYRADKPEALATRQAAAWDPYLYWLKEAFGVSLNATQGVAAVEQPDGSVASVRSALDGQPPEMLFAIAMLTKITGSAVIALSLWKRAFEPDAAFAVARLDETFQEERWGVDAEAAARVQDIKREFDACVRFLRFVD